MLEKDTLHLNITGHTTEHVVLGNVHSKWYRNNCTFLCKHSFPALGSFTVIVTWLSGKWTGTPQCKWREPTTYNYTA